MLEFHGPSRREGKWQKRDKRSDKCGREWKQRMPGESRLRRVTPFPPTSKNALRGSKGPGGTFRILEPGAQSGRYVPKVPYVIHRYVA